MAKVSFTKLGLKKNEEIKIINWNEQAIEIKQYLPVQEKLNLITSIVNNSIDENNFFNPVKIKIYMLLSIIDFYTNINFTEKQREDPCKLYDLLVSSELDKQIYNNLDNNDLKFITESVWECVKTIENYRQSMLGVMETMQSNYDNSEMDIKNLASDLQGLDVSLLKDIVNNFNANQM